MSTAESDELALDNWDDFGAGFDGHITASDHDAVGGLDDCLKMFVGFDSFLGLDFRDDVGSGAVRQ